jgi:hypothetical protein
MARRVVPSVPRDALVDRTASLEGQSAIRRLTCRPRRSAARASQTTLPCVPPVRRLETRIRRSGRRASGWMTRDDAQHCTGGCKGEARRR